MTRLTEHKIASLTTDGRSVVVFRDSALAGFGVQVTRSGKRSYVLRYRTPDGQRKQAILSRVGELPLRDARNLAAAELVRIRAGESDPLERRRTARAAPTVAEGLDRFFNEHAPERIAIGRMSPRTVREYGKQVRRYLIPALGRRKVADVTRRHVESMIEGLPRVQRNRVLALTSRMFTLFETWEWRPQHSNPARGIERAREEARDRVLSPSELSALAAELAAEAERYPAPVAAVRFAAVTGLRISEVLAVQWEHVDFEAGVLTLPKTKTGRRVHHLPAAALAILADTLKIGPWAFSSIGSAPVAYKSARGAFRRAATRARLEDVRLHDLRRTVMTTAAAAGVSSHVLRDLLGHKTTAMADRYVRAIGHPVRDAREAVGGAMAAMMAGESADVVTLRRV